MKFPLKAFVSAAVCAAVFAPGVFAQAGYPSEGETLPLSVERAKVLALENNRNILISREAVLAALGTAKSEKGGFDPVFEMGSSFNKLSEPSASSFVSGGTKTRILRAGAGVKGRLPSGGYYDLFRFSVSREKSDSPTRSLSPSFSASLDMKVGHDLLKGFGLRAGRTQIVVQSLRSDAAKLSFRIEVSETLFEVERRYWNLAAARQGYELRKRNLELGVDLLERNRVRVREGILPAIEQTKAESAVAARRVELIEAENDLRRAADRLKDLLGLPHEKRIRLTDADIGEKHAYEHSKLERLTKTAFENRDEIKIALKNVEIAEEKKHFQANQRLPKLAVDAFVSLRGLSGKSNPQRLVFPGAGGGASGFSGGLSEALAQVADGDSVSWGASVTMSVPIGNRRASGLYEAARSELNGAVFEYARTKEKIVLEVREASDNVWSGYRRLEAAETALKLSQELLEAEKEKYSAGLSTTREVLEAQGDLARARSEKARAAADYRTALAALRRATGTIMEADVADLTEGL